MNGSKSYRNGCAAKRIYLNQKQARRAIERYRIPDDRLQPYRCSHCHYWHLGHGTPMHFNRCAAKLCKLHIETARYALQALKDIARVSRFQPEPKGIWIDNRVISLFWENGEHWLELTITEVGIGDWFYWNRLDNTYGIAEYVIGDIMPIIRITK